jgi:hypothetical protein
LAKHWIFLEAIMTTKRSRTNSPGLRTDKNRKKRKNPNQFCNRGLGVFKILEISGEANSFFSCLALLNIDEYLTCETEYQTKALKEIKDDMLFNLEILQEMKGESASAEQFDDWIHDMGKDWKSADTIIMTMCCFVFQIDSLACIKLKTIIGDDIRSTFRPMEEQRVQMPV